MTKFLYKFTAWLFANALTALTMLGFILTFIFWFHGRDLPSYNELAQYAPPIISRIYSSEGHLMDEFAKERRLFVPYDDIPDLVKQAFVSAEDKNFFVHTGFDLIGIASAAFDALRGGRLRGASTITQQVAKNFLLSSERSAERKIKELLLATKIEQTLAKEEILELYLNEIFLGQNSFGIAAAAQTYFNKAPEELTISEAAYLAGLPKAPSKYHPVRNYERAIARRNFVLKEMYENGYIDAEEYAQAREMPLQTVQSGDIPSFREKLPARTYFTDEIRRRLSIEFGAESFFTEGLSVRATIDYALQEEAKQALRAGLEAYDRAQEEWRPTNRKIDQAALENPVLWRAGLAAVELPRDIDGWFLAVVLEEQKNRIRIGIDGVDGTHFIPAEDAQWARLRKSDGTLGPAARSPGDLVEIGDVVYVTSIYKDGVFQNWSLRQIPKVQGGFMAMDVNSGRVLAMQGGFSYQHSVFNRTTQALRQPGSVFKPFVYAAALDSGFTPAAIVVDAPIEIETPEGLWTPNNASEKFYGPSPLRLGIERSRNLMTIRLAREVGLDIIADYAESFGLYKTMDRFLSNSLGTQETTLFDVVSAYAMFANGGERVRPSLIDRIQDRWGHTIFRHDTRVCEDCLDPELPPGWAPLITSHRARVMDPITAYQLTSMLEGVVTHGTASRAINIDAPIAGKTGTTNQARDVWFVGFSSNIVAGCYIGYDQPQPLGEKASGSRLCAPVFNEFMKAAIAQYGSGEFRVPEGGVFVKINRYSGLPVPDETEGVQVVEEFFREGSEPSTGLVSIIDGGWAMQPSLPIFEAGEAPEIDEPQTIITSTGRETTLGKKSDFGTISDGGLY